MGRQKRPVQLDLLDWLHKQLTGQDTNAHAPECLARCIEDLGQPHSPLCPVAFWRHSDVNVNPTSH